MYRDRHADRLASAGAAGNFIVPLSAMSSNAFRTVLDIDTMGTFNTVKATMPHLLRSSCPRLIFISVTFHYTGAPLQAHVSAAKAAVDSLAVSVALEYGPLGVRCNVIAPGGIDATEGLARLGSAAPDTVKAYNAAIPLGRLGETRDIADTTVFLFSEGGSYINGEAIAVDGAAWRRQSAMPLGVSHEAKYPDFLLNGEVAKDLKDPRKGKQAKL
jgi:peroxisomal 2,4-dienoyl-CoA reductase